MTNGQSVFADIKFFTREDLSKTENRANLFLLASVVIDEFWKEFCKEMDLPESCILIPELNAENGRPDFVVRSDKMKILDYIECENWSENPKQSKNYAIGDRKPILILGPGKQPERGTNWSKIQEIAEKIEKSASPRQSVILTLLSGAINDIRRLAPRANIHDINFDDLQDDWLKRAAAPLINPPSGFCKAHRFAPGSESIRLCGPRSAFRGQERNGVVLVMSQRLRPKKVHVVASGHLYKHFSEDLRDWISESWQPTLNELTINGFNTSGTATIVIDKTDADPDLIANCLIKLASQLKKLVSS